MKWQMECDADMNEGIGRLLLILGKGSFLSHSGSQAHMEMLVRCTSCVCVCTIQWNLKKYAFMLRERVPEL